MGEYAEMVLDGDCCCACGAFIGDGDGYTRRCYNCEKYHTKAITKKVASKKPKQKMKRFPCQICGKNFAIMQQHLHHAHGITDDETHTK